MEDDGIWNAKAKTIKEDDGIWNAKATVKTLGRLDSSFHSLLHTSLV
jgi:hypothetical protein